MTDDVSRHRRPRESAIRRAWRAYHVEIILLLMAAAGLLLIFERSWLRLTLVNSARWLGGVVLQGADGFLALLDRFSPSDLLGLALVLVALGVIAWRIRWRAMRSPRLTTVACPVCGAVIHRIHRKWYDRVINWAAPVRRYRCANRACGWQGLRVAVPKGAPQPIPTKAAQHS
jgi:hypothetical protein